jgi:hypothetical protein
MSVGPAWLQCVTAYEIETDESKTLGRIRYMPSREMTEYVGFAAASCTGTRASQRLELEKRLRAVIPGDGKLVSYLLNVYWFKPH